MWSNKIIQQPVFFYFHLSNLTISFNCVFFVALEAWRLQLAALAAGRLFLFNFRLCRCKLIFILCRARSAASPVFQVILILFRL
jgi:hypothetical protein